LKLLQPCGQSDANYLYADFRVLRIHWVDIFSLGDIGEIFVKMIVARR